MASTGGKVLKRVLVAVAVLVAACLLAFAWYVSDYSRADATALAVVADENGAGDGVAVERTPDGQIAFIPDNPSVGLVFYPGAKVQPEAYAPLMDRCAHEGILCVIVAPPFNLTLLDTEAAHSVQARYSDVASWIVAGHSMGGVAACEYVSRHPSDVDALALLAAYPACDLTQFEGAVLSVLGSNDTVLNREAYDSARSMLPATTHEVVIEGGNHAYFGNYGEQAGDGVADISREEQQAQAVRAITALCPEGRLP